MIVVFPFSPKDQELALRNAKWITEIGGCRGHEVLAIADKRCGTISGEIQAELGRAFDKVHPLIAVAQIDGWPQGANYFFRLATSWLQNKPFRYFFWTEPDAIPLKAGWLDAIEAEYKTCSKKFMGDRVEVKDVPLHMSGIGVYPNPIYNFAGVAYMMHDVAWDVAAAPQIVPQTHWTRLIEHAWRHPQFTNDSEIETQIRKEAVIFHSSKDGSLIDLLRGRKHLEFITQDSTQTKKDTDKPVSPSPGNFTKCDIFIRTYPKDYPWLNYCLRSINKFCTGFNKIWIVSPEQAPFAPQGVEWKVMNEESDDGYLSQQITKLYADVITNYEADYYLHVDSDVIFTRPTTPMDFLQNEKVIWYYTPYEHTKTPWQPITEKFIGQKVDNEFMRRFPIMVPKWLYAALRKFCHETHGRRIISEYVRNQPHRSFSEFNALGAYAWAEHRDEISWVNTLETQLPEPRAKQYHSWSGLTDEIKTEIEGILGGSLNSENVSGDTNLPTAQELPNGETETFTSPKGHIVSVPDQVRYHVDSLAELWNDKQHRKVQIVKELRRVKLVPQRFRS